MKLEARTVRPPGMGIEFDVLADDAIIGPAIERGSWGDHETALMLAHLAPGARVLDLGANVGWFAVQAILAGCEVHAFEPVPAIAELARRNMQRAEKVGKGKGVLHVAAAGDRPGRAVIALAAKNHGDNRVLDARDARPSDMAAAETVDIEIVRVDDVVAGPFRFVKIDTQGSEWLAVQGATKAIDSSPELGLLMEFWPYALRGAKPEALLDWLFQRGFSLGKATEAPYPMTKDRILRQASSRDPVKGGIDLYGARGTAFHVLGLKPRLHGLWRAMRES
ncbi:MAG: FkbM family methyltransferase [Planctomycetes bacterium]|nr:FkbM family methyltransferase [Planctomycetota bacterium]